MLLVASTRLAAGGWHVYVVGIDPEPARGAAQVVVEVAFLVRGFRPSLPRVVGAGIGGPDSIMRERHSIQCGVDKRPRLGMVCADWRTEGHSARPSGRSRVNTGPLLDQQTTPLAGFCPTGFDRAEGYSLSGQFPSAQSAFSHR